MTLYPMDKMLKNMESRYLLVNVVAHRARQISAEAEREEISLTEKPVTIALDEVLTGELKPETLEETPEVQTES